MSFCLNGIVDLIHKISFYSYLNTLKYIKIEESNFNNARKISIENTIEMTTSNNLLRKKPDTKFAKKVGELKKAFKLIPLEIIPKDSDIMITKHLN